MKKQTKVAAIQLATKVGDSTANIASCQRLSLLAVHEGARWIALPEFFTTGVSWNPRIVAAIQTTDGTAICWEFMRTMTARRLRNQVDVIMGGSCWWSIPTNYPGWLQRLWEPENSRNALAAIKDSARLIGAPVIHAAHCGEIECPMPGLPIIKYRGFFEGNAAIVDANGHVLAHRSAKQGEGIVCAEISLGAQATTEEIPNRYWLRNRGLLPTLAWHHHRWLGRHWYARNVRQA